MIIHELLKLNLILIIFLLIIMLIKIDKLIKIQKVYRGFNYRKKHLPIILNIMQKFLENSNLKLSNLSNDGRINSSINETYIINLLKNKFKNYIKEPIYKRHWFDILVKDYYYGWLPINIKISMCSTADNTGNLAMCVYSYTDALLDFDKKYNNGDLAKILIKKLNEKKYNKNIKKDYYFLVINKKNQNEIIINSIKGLSFLTPNKNNLPFQIKWNKNKEFQYKKVTKSIEQFLELYKNPNPSWREYFLSKISDINK